MIELPSLSQAEQVKHSHKDFYTIEDGKDTDETEQTLIQAKFEELAGTLAKAGQERSDYLRLSNQPYSKWQAIFNLEQIKERNKPTLPKKELPKAPFFLFDIEKIVMENDATPDLLKEQFFTSKQQQADSKKHSLMGEAITLKKLL